MSLIYPTSLCFVVAVLCLHYASVVEWVLHLRVMHMPVGKLTYPYKAHALTHHRIFRADNSYHLKDPKDKEKVRMAWWNGPVLVVIAAIPWDIVAAVLWMFGWQLECWIVCIVPHMVLACYYGTYEYLHWCMHWSKKRRLEFSKFFRFLNGHHVLHHRCWNKNLNVVYPFADWLFGTLLIRSPTRFAQVRGPSVPDVQPLRI